MVYTTSKSIITGHLNGLTAGFIILLIIQGRKIPMMQNYPSMLHMLTLLRQNVDHREYVPMNIGISDPEVAYGIQDATHDKNSIT